MAIFDFSPRRCVRLALAISTCAALVSLAIVAPALRAQSSQSSSSAPAAAPTFAHEKAPALVDPAGPAISLVSSETLFYMAAALNACGYNDGLADSDPLRQHVRDQMSQAFASSEGARQARDKLCLFIAQHRLTGTVMDVSQYISLALYLAPPPDLETSVELPDMPPDAVAVVEILPLLRDFAAAIELNDIWLLDHRAYDDLINQLHDPITQMTLSTDYYLKMPVSTYDGRRFLVVVEPQLNPHTINARIYGPDFIDIVSPVHGQVRMADIRHTYLHYIIEPLLYSRATLMDRFLPLLKYVREAPIDNQHRSDIVDLTIECLIKAIEARTMDTGIPNYVVPPNAKRSDFERIEHDKGVVQSRQEAVRVAQVRHDLAQGWILTAYFYEQLVQFEHDPSSLKDSIGEIVYSMDVEHEEKRAKQIVFDAEGDQDVLHRPAPRRLTGLDLAEAKIAAGDGKTAAALAQQALSIAATDNNIDVGRADFILARAAILAGQPEQAITDFHKAVALAHENRIKAWSHIYLGRMLDLDCHRDAALTEYKAALAIRDGQMDTRVAADRGVKAAYAVNGHTCSAEDSSSDDSDDDSPPPGNAKPGNLKPGNAHPAQPPAAGPAA